MEADISLKKGTGIPSFLKYGEPAIDTDGKVLYVGIDENGGSNYAKFIDETEIDKKIDYSLQELKSLQYYGDVNIVPSDVDLFKFTVNEDGETASVVFNGEKNEHNEFKYEGDIVVPYEYVDKNGKSYIVTEVDVNAFCPGPNIKSITIPNSVTSIGRGAFAFCKSLTSIIIPNSVTSIGDFAFNYCNSLTNIEIPDSVTSIGDSAFYNCSSLTSITIPNSVTSIGDDAFAFCSSIPSITIPNSVTSIGDDAFYYCSRLTSITIPDSVTSIGDCAFYVCESLTNITLPDSVTSIGDYAFRNCRGLTSITIPESVTSIEDVAFEGCISLANIYYKGTKAQWGAIEIAEGNDNLLNATIHYEWTDVTKGYVDEKIKDIVIEGGGTVVDDELDLNSENPVQNKVITEKFNEIDDKDSVLLSGEGEYSIKNRDNNLAIGNDSISIGIDTKSGCRGYYFNGIDFKKKKIYLCKTQKVPVNIVDDISLLDENFETPLYKINEMFSINNYAGYYDFCGKIISIEHNVITYDILPFDITGVDTKGNIANLEDLDINDFVFYVPTQPEIGLVVFAPGGMANGDGAIASGEFSLALGRDVTAGGRFGVAFGRNTKAGYTGFSIGQGNTVTGANSLVGGNDSKCNGKTSLAFGLQCYVDKLAEYSIVLGSNSQAYDKRSFVAGYGLVSKVPFQTVLGNFNVRDNDENKLLIVGNGTSGNYSNAFVLNKNGSAWFSGDVTVGDNKEKLAKEYYVKEIDSKIKSLQYYGDASIIPSDASLFNFTINEDGKTAGVVFNGEKNEYDEFIYDEDIVVPYEYVDKNGKSYIVTEVDANAFSKGNNIKSIIIPNSVMNIGTGAFCDCFNLTNITIPNSVTNIGSNAFNYCSSLKSVTIPNNVINIGDSAFDGCSSLTSITIPDSVTSIESFTFGYCANLKNITIPDSVTNIGAAVFEDCSNLIDIYYEGTKEQWDDIDIGANNEVLTNATIHYEWTDVTKGYVDGKFEDILEKTVNKSDCKGCYFSSIDFDNKKIYLSKSETPVIPVNGKNHMDATFPIQPYSVGDEFSINNADAYYDFCGKITDIYCNEISYEGNYDGELPFSSTGNVTDESKIDTNDYIFYVPAKPDVGLVIFATGSIDSGNGAIASGDNSLAVGRDVIAGGRYSVALGRNNKSGYTGFSIGQGNMVDGSNSFVGGQESKNHGLTSLVFGLQNYIDELADYSVVLGNNCKAYKTKAFLIGSGLVSQIPNQIILGFFNKQDKDTNKLLIVGNGTSSTYSNAHVLDRQGNAWFAGDVKIGENNEKLATETYVDDKVKELDDKIGDVETVFDKIIAQQESIIAIQNALIGGDSE